MTLLATQDMYVAKLLIVFGYLHYLPMFCSISCKNHSPQPFGLWQIGLKIRAQSVQLDMKIAQSPNLKPMDNLLYINTRSIFIKVLKKSQKRLKNSVISDSLGLYCKRYLPGNSFTVESRQNGRYPQDCHLFRVSKSTPQKLLLYNWI